VLDALRAILIEGTAKGRTPEAWDWDIPGQLRGASQGYQHALAGL